MKNLNIEFTWDFPIDKEMFISLKAIVNKGGYFSPKQALYYKKNMSQFQKGNKEKSKYYMSGSEKELHKDEYYKHLSGTMNAAAWRSNSRRFGWTFVLDKYGIVAMHKLGFEYGKGDMRGWSGIDPQKVTEVFKRKQSKKKISDIDNGYCEREQWLATLEKRKAKREYVGEIGQKGYQVKGVINFVTQFSTRYGVSYITVIRDENDNAIKQMGSYIGEKGKNVFLIANIKAHEIYRDEKQTIITRPRKIECK